MNEGGESRVNVSAEGYPWIYTNITADEPNDQLFLLQLSSGLDPDSPTYINVFEMQFLLDIKADQLQSRRFLKGLEEEHRRGRLVVILAEKKEQLDQIEDYSLKRWILQQCDLIINKNLI